MTIEDYVIVHPSMGSGFEIYECSFCGDRRTIEWTRDIEPERRASEFRTAHRHESDLRARVTALEDEVARLKLNGGQ